MTRGRLLLCSCFSFDHPLVAARLLLLGRTSHFWECVHRSCHAGHGHSHGHACFQPAKGRTKMLFDVGYYHPIARRRGSVREYWSLKSIARRPHIGSWHGRETNPWLRLHPRHLTPKRPTARQIYQQRVANTDMLVM